MSNRFTIICRGQVNLSENSWICDHLLFCWVLSVHWLRECTMIINQMLLYSVLAFYISFVIQISMMNLQFDFFHKSKYLINSFIREKIVLLEYIWSTNKWKLIWYKLKVFSIWWGWVCDWGYAVRMMIKIKKIIIICRQQYHWGLWYIVNSIWLIQEMR